MDSASERSYQQVFCQILAATGHRVLHSTRHTGIEFGKDVFTVGPDGVGCAYQLKGNPGKKLTLKQYREEVQEQIIQLVTQPVIFPGFPNEPHRSYLVTNGEFEEEVHRSVDDLNRAGYYSKLELIPRGVLYSQCLDLGLSLWPSEIQDSRKLLEIYLSNPNSQVDIPNLSSILGGILKIEGMRPRFQFKSEFVRAVPSAALLTGISTSGHVEQRNHWAVISAWCMFYVSVIGSADKHGYRIDGSVLHSLNLAYQSIMDELVQLWQEVASRSHMVEGIPITDQVVYRWRYTLLLGLFSVLMLEDERSSVLSEEARTQLESWLTKKHEHAVLWGEGAVPSFYLWLTWLRKYDPTIRPDYQIAQLVRAVLHLNRNGNDHALVGPYVSYEEVTKLRMGLAGVEDDIAWDRESFDGVSHVTESLYHLLVRTNLKQACKGFWPEYSKIMHCSCIPDEAWEYCTVSIKSGVEEARIYPETYLWSDLRADALKSAYDRVPDELLCRPWLVALWWLLVPYRMTPWACAAYIEQVHPGWGHPL